MSKKNFGISLFFLIGIIATSGIEATHFNVTPNPIQNKKLRGAAIEKARNQELEQIQKRQQNQKKQTQQQPAKSQMPPVNAPIIPQEQTANQEEPGHLKSTWQGIKKALFSLSTYQSIASSIAATKIIKQISPESSGFKNFALVTATQIGLDMLVNAGINLFRTPKTNTNDETNEENTPEPNLTKELSSLGTQLSLSYFASKLVS